jgi:hypothetical protein
MGRGCQGNTDSGIEKSKRNVTHMTRTIQTGNIAFAIRVMQLTCLTKRQRNPPRNPFVSESWQPAGQFLPHRGESKRVP